ncbi:hypothetical protein [Rhizobium sp. RU36D]|uniref:hypothetical protein n=1 Tax=Rhizobium sp. RU36D TaxID=1907415 RepID=UPI0009D854C6|nr:hypothetical protein [Rhizobium sp. RU36D]SMD19432.1 hypothetical protein SAMN05880593_1414 [Rhizobium sp. RU36D]
MGCSATEKLEIIRLVELSQLSVRNTLVKPGFQGRPFAVEIMVSWPMASRVRKTVPPRVTGTKPLPDDIGDPIVIMALDHANLPPRELAVMLTDAQS